MVEHSSSRDKQKRDREKKIKRVKGSSEDKRVKQELREVARGSLDPNDFDERHSGQTE